MDALINKGITSTQRAHDTGCVVVIDDDPMCRKMIEQVVSDDGFVVRAYEPDEMALLGVRNSQPDAVIVDVGFGESTERLSVIEELRADPATRAIPIIACSTDKTLLDKHATMFQRQRCQIITKPFNIDLLQEMVRAVIPPPVGTLCRRMP